MNRERNAEWEQAGSKYQGRVVRNTVKTDEQRSQQVIPSKEKKKKIAADEESSGQERIPKWSLLMCDIVLT